MRVSLLPADARRFGAVMLVAAALLPACVSTPASAASGRTVFYDGFDGTELDRTRWTVRTTEGVVNDEQQLYVDELGNIAIAHGKQAAGAHGGVLSLRASWAPGGRGPQGERLDFRSARLDTRGKFEFEQGVAAARMKLPAGSGLWPAFWILGVGDWPATGEIDVMEAVGDRDWVSAALHGPGYFGDTPMLNRGYFPPGQDLTGWHVYAVEWSSDALVFTIDDRLIYRVTRTMVEHYGKWAFDNPKYLILNLAVGGAYPQKINGVRAPYPGLPQPTVDAIRRGDAEVLVDWVRVTAN
jgi:beta-glucanase (GH16 family)